MNWTIDEVLIFANEMQKDLSTKDLRLLITYLNFKLKIKEMKEKI